MQQIMLSLFINRVLPILAGAFGTLLIEHGLLEPETVKAIATAFGGA